MICQKVLTVELRLWYYSWVLITRNSISWIFSIPLQLPKVKYFKDRTSLGHILLVSWTWLTFQKKDYLVYVYDKKSMKSMFIFVMYLNIYQSVNYTSRFSDRYIAIINHFQIKFKIYTKMNQMLGLLWNKIDINIITQYDRQWSIYRKIHYKRHHYKQD